MKALVAFVAVLIFSCPVFSQNQPAPVPAACGDLKVSMAVDLNKDQHAIAEPESGKARIYFIEDTGLVFKVAYPTTRMGIDGRWVGANKKDSYFSVSVEPGEHHLCVAVQSAFLARNTHEVIALAHLTAEAGKVYYYRTTIVYSENGPTYLVFDPADSDEAKYLIELSPLATAHAKN